MLVSLGMDVASMVEDILSDEYEEGEILDDDILYENVSSLEEFSDVDDRKSKGARPDAKKAKNRRKKEHKCKVDSLCRLERSGKHCYARIRRRSSLELKSRNANLDCDDKKQRPRSAKSISPNRGFKRDTFNKDSAKAKDQSDVRKRGLPLPYYFQHDNRLQPPKKVFPDRRCKKRLSVEDRSGSRKRKSRSPSPWSGKLVDSKRQPQPVPTKSSLLERLVGSGVIPVKTYVENDSKPMDSVDLTVPEESSSNDCSQPNFGLDSIDEAGDAKDTEACPADIPVPPTPKAVSPEPPKQEIEELHLRLNALKTAIMKKHTDLKRKKRLAASKKRDSVEDSFTEFAMSALIEDECESIPTPPPPGTDWPVAPLDDNRWSDEDMVIDQESVCGDVVIESNIPASDPSLQSFDYVAVSSPSSQDKLPCCKGNPIPVITPHRPAREAGPVKNITCSVIPVVCGDERGMKRTGKEPVERRTPSGSSRSSLPPKYLKEINSIKLLRRRRRSVRNPRIRRASINIKQGLKHSFKPERPKPIEGDDDEDELRKLALMSVKPKPTITEGLLTTVGTDLNPLCIETDQNAAADKIDSPAKHPSPAEPWDDLDEDILRAQLLSSLSRSIPDGAAVPAPKRNSPVEFKKQNLTMRVNKENLYTRRNALSSTKPLKKNPAKFINPNAKPSLTPPLNPPKVEKFIIKVSDSETSEDEELKLAKSRIGAGIDASIRKSLIELSIDRLLEETRKETELIQKASEFYPVFSVLETDNRKVPPIEENVATLAVENVLQPLEEKRDENLPSSSASQTKGLSQLPAWQQEEFVRQKRVMAYKGSLIEAAKKKIREKTELQPQGSVDSTEKSIPETSVQKPSENPAENEGVGEPVEEELRVVGYESKDPALVTESSNPVPQPGVDMSCEIRAILEDILTKLCNDVVTDSTTGALQSIGGGSTIEGTSTTGALQSIGGVSTTEGTSRSEKREVDQSEPVKLSPKPKIPSVGVQIKNPKLLSKPLVAPGKLQPAALKKAMANPVTKPTSSRDRAGQKPFVFKDSSYAAKALNEMVDMVTGFENGMSEYKAIKKDYIALRKQLVLAHQKMSKKRQELMDVKGSVLNKRRFLESTLTMDTSSLSPLPDIREQPKQSSRDSELFALRFKEVCLRAQFAMMGLETTVRPGGKPVVKPAPKPTVRPAAPQAVRNSRPPENPALSPRKRLKLRPRQVEKLRPFTVDKKPVKPVSSEPPKSQQLPGTSKKLVVSVLDKDRMDPLIPLCPYDMTGVCKDEECKYQHLRTE